MGQWVQGTTRRRVRLGSFSTLTSETVFSMYVHSFLTEHVEERSSGHKFGRM